MGPVIFLLNAADPTSDHIAFRVVEVVELMIIKAMDVTGNRAAPVVAINLGRIH